LLRLLLSLLLRLISLLQLLPQLLDLLLLGRKRVAEGLNILRGNSRRCSSGSFLRRRGPRSLRQQAGRG
jgi:hypothetical protein